MAHLTARNAYGRLADRLNRFPQGAPPSEVLFRILALLFSEQEAALVAVLPIRPFTTRQAARAWKRPEGETRRALEGLADRGILLDMIDGDQVRYILPPPMAGFFEFSMMRVRQDLDQKLLAELFHQYINVEEEFITGLFAGLDTHMGRAFVHEPALTPEVSLHVLDYERASEVVRTASHRAVSTCYCRHKMAHLGRACAAPLDICLTFGNVARALSSRSIARAIDEKEATDLLQQAWNEQLVQFGENVRERVSFICNCCGCCCEALLAQKRFAILHPVHTTGWRPTFDAHACSSCGACADRCPVGALAMADVPSSAQPGPSPVTLDVDRCIGCGLCSRACPSGGIRLESRGPRVLTPLNSSHKYLLMAIERGQLPNLIFDQHALWNHRAMAAILGGILRLPPVQRALASRQLRSRYLEWLLARA